MRPRQVPESSNDRRVGRKDDELIDIIAACGYFVDANPVQAGDPFECRRMPRSDATSHIGNLVFGVLIRG
jgi:hypothetical protein